MKQTQRGSRTTPGRTLRPGQLFSFVEGYRVSLVLCNTRALWSCIGSDGRIERVSSPDWYGGSVHVYRAENCPIGAPPS